MNRERRYRVGQAASLARVTIRTLHHYDEIGLLVPSHRTEAGYRLYTAADLRRLHRILLCRELGLPLEEIRRLLDDPAYDLAAALAERRRELRAEMARKREVARTLERALRILEEGDSVEVETMFEGFEAFDHAQHAEEAEARWGKTEAWRESARRTKGYGREEFARIRSEHGEILEAMAARQAEGALPEDAGPREVAERHRLHIDRWFYPCAPRMHASLADLYVTDPRFAATFDALGEGMAAYFAAAVRANAGVV